jgi:predicted transcriptional regulator
VVQQLASEVDLATTAASSGSLADYLSATDASLAEIGPWLEGLDNGLESHSLNRRRR